jgi:hypothetical protein
MVFTSEGRSCRPSSKAAASPSRRTASSSSPLTFSTTSSIRAGMNPPVGDQRLDCLSRDLAAVGVEAREDDGARGIVNDQVNAGGQFERPDIASFAADDAALEVVARQVDHGHGCFDRMFGRVRCIASVTAGLGAGQPSRELRCSSRLTRSGGIPPAVRFDLPEQQLLRFVGREAGNPLKLPLLFGGRVRRNVRPWPQWHARGRESPVPARPARALLRLGLGQALGELLFPLGENVVDGIVSCCRRSRTCRSASSRTSWAFSLASSSISLRESRPRARRSRISCDACWSASPSVWAARRLRLSQ